MESINGFPGNFPIASGMPLSFEVAPDPDQRVEFANALMNAFEDLDKLKKKADQLSDDIYIYGKDEEIQDAAVADEMHGQKKHVFSTILRTHTNLAQTLFNVQI